MKRNSEQEISLFHVERDVPYWWFFDLYGSTAKIQIFTGTVESPKRCNTSAVGIRNSNGMRKYTNIF